MISLDAPKEGASRKGGRVARAGFSPTQDPFGGSAAFGDFPQTGFSDSSAFGDPAPFGAAGAAAFGGASDFSVAADSWGAASSAAGWPGDDGSSSSAAFGEFPSAAVGASPFPSSDAAAASSWASTTSAFPPPQANGSSAAMGGFGSSAFPEAAPAAAPAFPPTEAPETSSASSGASGGWAIDEQRLAMYEGAFKKADSNEDGYVEPDEIVQVLQRTGLPNEELSKIWRLSDADGDGRLSFGEFLCAVHVGFRRSKEGVDIPVTMPPEIAAFCGVSKRAETVPASTAPTAAPVTVAAQPPERGAEASQPAAVSVQAEIPPDATWFVGTEEMTRCRMIFEQLSSGTGFVDASTGKDLFESSQLPVEELARIWQMADIDCDGRLSPDEFVRAMVLVDRRRSGLALPVELPRELLVLSSPESAAPGFVAGPSSCSNPVPGAVEDASWEVLDSELERYGPIYAQLDPEGSGYVSADNGRELFESSGLPLHELGQIWQMSDLDEDGRLAPHEFMAAMILVARRRQGLQLPATLPQEVRSAVLKHVQREENPTGLQQQQQQQQQQSAPQPPPESAAAAPQVDVAAYPPSGGPDWVASKEELMRYRRIFLEKAAGVNEAGVTPFIDGGTAKVVMDQSNLPVEDLCAIWALSDRNANGFLVLPEFLSAMSIVGRRLKGHPMPGALPRELINSVELTMANLEGREPADWALEEIVENSSVAPPPSNGGKAAPLAPATVANASPPQAEETPQTVSVAAPPPPAPMAAPTPAAASASCCSGDQSAAATQIVLSPPTPAELERYRDIFFQKVEAEKLQPAILNAFHCREIFESSGLPILELKAIFELADVDRDGQLWLGEFACAMALIGRRRQGLELPTSLPGELLEVIETAPRPDPVAASAPEPAAASPPVACVVAEATPATPPAASPSSSAAAWSAGEEELAKYRAIFGKLNTSGTGIVNSEAARAVLQRSQLPTAQVLQIWDLLGTGESGLSCGAFCCAVLLASRCRQGATLPTSLPESLRQMWRSMDAQA